MRVRKNDTGHISAKPGFRRALPRVLRGCRVGGAAGAFARDSPAAPERCEPVRLGGRAWDSQGGVPLGRGAWGTQPHARCGTFRRAFPAEGPGGIAEPAQARRKPVAGGVQGSGLPGSARAGPSQPRCRGELGARRGRSRRLRPLRAPGAGRYAMDSANEPSLLMWCLSGALPALTTIMSMPSKRTGTSPSGV